MKKSARKSTRTTSSGAALQKPVQPIASGYVGKPLDGSQYIDVIEEQEYADQRPSADEQKPRYSYLGNQK